MATLQREAPGQSGEPARKPVPRPALVGMPVASHATRGGASANSLKNLLNMLSIAMIRWFSRLPRRFLAEFRRSGRTHRAGAGPSRNPARRDRLRPWLGGALPRSDARVAHRAR